jgi:hypothetical protein
MTTDLIFAIQNRLTVKISYDGGDRIIEPHCFGLARTNNNLLRAYQTAGYSNTRKLGWKLLNIKKVQSFEILDQNFNVRYDYKRNDKAMTRIYSQL